MNETFSTIFYVVVFCAVFFAVLIILDILAGAYSGWTRWQDERAAKVESELGESFVFLEKRKMMLFSLAPLIMAGIMFLLFGHPIAAALGFVIGFFMPGILVRMAKANRIKKFQSQLVDTLRIFTSSLKGGLSFIQAMETVCEEMPVPTNQEFGLILKENRLGVSIEDSLNGLRTRMPLEEVNLMVSAILVARETGGELTKVFVRLVDTIRSNIKLKEKMTTLTLQGRLQGLIMSLLPFVFTWYIYKQNNEHFKIMIEHPKGRMMIMVGVGLYIIGIFLIKKISTIKI